MNSHKHARLTPRGRALLVERVLEQGWTVQEASWLPASVGARATSGSGGLRPKAPQGLFDRSCRPHHSPTAIPARKRRRLEQLRRRRWPMWRIARDQGCSLATVGRYMNAWGCLD